VFGIPLLVLLTTYVISSAMRSPAGEEESGLLDVTLSYPLTRRNLVLVRAASTAISVTVIGIAVLIVTLALRNAAGLNIGVDRLVAACVGAVLLGWCLGAIMLLISAASGSRSTTLGLGVTTALIAYLADSFLPLIHHLGWVRHLSPYYWFSGGDPLSRGLSGSHSALLLILAAASTLVAVAAFERRDLRV
jgi:ABC-2 type transport system permease protein